MYVFSGRNTRHAISRPTHKRIKEGELIQLNIGARVAGYSSSIVRPVFFGKMDKNLRKLVEVGLELHNETKELMREGVVASEVVKAFLKSAEKKGGNQKHIIWSMSWYRVNGG